MRRVCEVLSVSERRACKVLGQCRTTQRYSSGIGNEEVKLMARIIELATQYGRYGYRRITALLKREGFKVNHKKVERIWRSEGLKVPQKQPKRRKLWLTDDSCIRLRPEYKDYVWIYHFVTARTSDGRAFRILTIIDEYTRECLAILVDRRISSQDVIYRIFNLFVFRGIPEHTRLDNSPEFTGKAIRIWLNHLGVKTLFIEPGSLWENGYIELFNGKLEMNCLTGRYSLHG